MVAPWWEWRDLSLLWPLRSLVIPKGKRSGARRRKHNEVGDCLYCLGIIKIICSILLVLAGMKSLFL